MKKPLLLIILLLGYVNNLFSQITFQETFSELGFDFITEIQNPVAEEDYFYIVQQDGFIKRFPNRDNVQESEVQDVLDISNQVNFSFGQELGLLGLAFHPNFINNRIFFVYYTSTSPVSGSGARMILSKFVANDINSKAIDTSTEEVILRFDKNQRQSNHNGGKIGFGPDGYLYISVGDGGGGNDPQRNSQNTNNAFGSILRIDIDLDGNNPVETNPNFPNGRYEIPSDNPFINNTNGLEEIYAYGIRNTWKFSWDSDTGIMYGGDVGQNATEEINIIQKGKNYGWARFEGNRIANPGVNLNGTDQKPIFTYAQNNGNRSVTGGFVYRGAAVSSLSPNIKGTYVYGDFVSGRVWSLEYNPSTGQTNNRLLFQASGNSISVFAEDKQGEIYFADYGLGGKIYKIIDGVTPSLGTIVEGVGKWSNPFENGTNGEVKGVDSFNDNIYCGGKFSKIGNEMANNIAQWNPVQKWQNIGQGIKGVVNDLVVDSSGNLYVGGVFTQAGSVEVANIAMWDGVNWSTLQGGIEGSIATLALDNNDNLYVGGIFENINGQQVSNIAMWDGASWTALTDALSNIAGTNNEIRALE